MASSKGLGADPAYLRLIDLARVTGDIDLVKGMEHLSHNSRLDKNFPIYDGTSKVGLTAFQALGLPREGITVRQAMARTHAYATSRDGHGYAEFANALAVYLETSVGVATVDVGAAMPAALVGPDEFSPYATWGKEVFNQRQGALLRWVKSQSGATPMLLALERALRHHGWHSSDCVPFSVHDRFAYPTSQAQPSRAAKEAVLAGVLPRECFNGWPGDEGELTTTGKQAFACLSQLQAAGVPREILAPFMEAWDPVPAGGEADSEGAWRGNVDGVPYRPQDREAAPQDEAQVFSRNPDLIDRGTVAHMEVQDSLAEFVRGHGLAPLSPLGGGPQFDLAWRDGSSVVVCEVKSLTVENEVSQLRLGLGQVLSYMYKLDWRDADQVVGVLAVEREPVDADWVSICGQNGVILTWAPDFPGVFPLGLSKEQEAETPDDDKPRNLHHRVFPYMDHFMQYANDCGPERSPWVVRDRSTSLRNERQGRGRALRRRWAPGAWEEVTGSSPQD